MARNLALWAGCAFLWCVVDRLTKAYFDSNFHVGQIAVPDILGLVQLNLVHNKGVAWGAFAGNVPIIAIATSLMCIGIAAFSFYWARRSSMPEMIGLGLLFAGGIGNLYDRIAQGYVVVSSHRSLLISQLLILPTLVLTCGIALLAMCWIVQIVREGKSPHETSSTKEE